jgi:HlyD family secretion protein
LIKLELTDLEQLLQKNLVAAPRVNAIRRDAARIEGERGQLTAQIAQANSRIVETEFQIVQIDQDLRTEIVRGVGARIADRGYELQLCSCSEFPHAIQVP